MNEFVKIFALANVGAFLKSSLTKEKEALYVEESKADRFHHISATHYRRSWRYWTQGKSRYSTSVLYHSLSTTQSLLSTLATSEGVR